MEGRACRNLVSSLPSPTSDNQMSDENLGLSGFDGREDGKDAWLVLCLTRKQTTKCCEEDQLFGLKHVYPTQLRNTREDSCGLNGGQSTETKRVLTRKCQGQESKSPFLSHPTEGSGR